MIFFLCAGVFGRELYDIETSGDSNESYGYGIYYYIPYAYEPEGDDLNARNPSNGHERVSYNSNIGEYDNSNEVFHEARISNETIISTFGSGNVTQYLSEQKGQRLCGLPLFMKSEWCTDKAVSRKLSDCEKTSALAAFVIFNLSFGICIILVNALLPLLLVLDKKMRNRNNYIKCENK